MSDIKAIWLQKIFAISRPISALSCNLHHHVHDVNTFKGTYQICYDSHKFKLKPPDFLRSGMGNMLNDTKHGYAYKQNSLKIIKVHRPVSK